MASVPSSFKMSSSFKPSSFKKHPAGVFLAILIVALLATAVQLPSLIWGWELCDSGFYATFYANFFGHPDAVAYNFMYWLSGLFGGTVDALFPGSLMALRWAGLLTGVGCALTVWGVMRFVPHSHTAVLGAILLICAGTWQSPLTLSYDQITALLACLSVASMFRGLNPRRGRGMLWILLGGFLAGLNAFTRIPNVLQVLFVFLIPMWNSHDRLLVKRGCTSFLCGWGVAITTGLLAMLAMGHLGIFTSTLRELFGIALSGTDADAAASHSVANLLRAQADSWWPVVRLSMLLCCSGGAVWMSMLAVQERGRMWRTVGVAGACLSAIWGGWLLWRAPLTVSTASVSLLGCGGVLMWMRGRKLRFLAAAGLAMMLIMPLGSDFGIFNQGTLPMWMACAPALWFWINAYRTMGDRSKTPALLTGPWIGLGGVAVIFISVLLFTLRHGFYFDDTPPAEACSEVAQTGILTSPRRAADTPVMLATLREYAAPGDTLLVYGSAPMLNYLTGTLPAIGTSWPEQLSPQSLRLKLNAMTIRPVVVVLRFNTIGGWGEPSGSFERGLGPGTGIYHNPAKTRVLEAWLRSRRYRPATSTPHLTLWLPPETEM